MIVRADGGELANITKAGEKKMAAVAAAKRAQQSEQILSNRAVDGNSRAGNYLLSSQPPEPMSRSAQNDIENNTLPNEIHLLQYCGVAAGWDSVCRKYLNNIYYTLCGGHPDDLPLNDVLRINATLAEDRVLSFICIFSTGEILYLLKFDVVI